MAMDQPRSQPVEASRGVFRDELNIEEIKHSFSEFALHSIKQNIIEAINDAVKSFDSWELHDDHNPLDYFLDTLYTNIIAQGNIYLGGEDHGLEQKKELADQAMEHIFNNASIEKFIDDPDFAKKAYHVYDALESYYGKLPEGAEEEKNTSIAMSLYGLYMVEKNIVIND